MPDRVFCRRHDPDGHANWDSGFRPFLDDTCYMCATEQLEQQLHQARRAAEESAKDAYRRGWEQCQREARGKLSARYERYLNSETIYILNEIECCERAIAAMEYKEKVND